MAEPLKMKTRWTWGPGRACVRIVHVTGGDMPIEIRARFAGVGPDFLEGHELYRKAELVASPSILQRKRKSTSI